MYHRQGDYEGQKIRRTDSMNNGVPYQGGFNQNSGPQYGGPPSHGGYGGPPSRGGFGGPHGGPPLHGGYGGPPSRGGFGGPRGGFGGRGRGGPRGGFGGPPSRGGFGGPRGGFGGRGRGGPRGRGRGGFGGRGRGGPRGRGRGGPRGRGRGTGPKSRMFTTKLVLNSTFDELDFEKHGDTWKIKVDPNDQNTEEKCRQETVKELFETLEKQPQKEGLQFVAKFARLEAKAIKVGKVKVSELESHKMSTAMKDEDANLILQELERLGFQEKKGMGVQQITFQVPKFDHDGFKAKLRTIIKPDGSLSVSAAREFVGKKTLLHVDIANPVTFPYSFRFSLTSKHEIPFEQSSKDGIKTELGKFQCHHSDFETFEKENMDSLKRMDELMQGLQNIRLQKKDIFSDGVLDIEIGEIRDRDQKKSFFEIEAFIPMPNLNPDTVNKLYTVMNAICNALSTRSQTSQGNA